MDEDNGFRGHAIRHLEQIFHPMLALGNDEVKCIESIDYITINRQRKLVRFFLALSDGKTIQFDSCPTMEWHSAVVKFVKQLIYERNVQRFWNCVEGDTGGELVYTLQDKHSVVWGGAFYEHVQEEAEQQQRSFAELQTTTRDLRDQVAVVALQLQRMEDTLRNLNIVRF